tara:strand:+ start:289 stop:483 length:195 start_codon:yes stop_codon:yes gene_type:complete
MYWLVLVLSISGMPDITMENQMGGYFTCQIAKQKFEDANPPNIIIKGKEKKSNFTSIECVKKGK